MIFIIQTTVHKKGTSETIFDAFSGIEKANKLDSAKFFPGALGNRAFRKAG